MESVLLLTFPQAVFSERPDIYFKIAEQIRFEEYIRLAKSAVRLLLVKQKTALSVAVETDESIDSVLLYEQLSKNLEKVPWIFWYLQSRMVKMVLRLGFTMNTYG